MLDPKYALTTIVKPAEDGLMIKEIVYGRLKLSRGLLRRMKRGGGVYRNGQKDFLTQRVKVGDQLQIFFYDEPTDMEPEPIFLDIVYEDDYLMVINKPAGMAVHPTGSYQEGTLANAIAHHWQKIGLRTKVRLVHRIDRNTSGLILVAKEPYTLQRLLAQLANNTLIRDYLAIVEGIPQTLSGTITAPIGRSMDHGVKRAVRPGGKLASTTYQALCVGNNASLLSLSLLSGRTHQIRVHLASIGHPLMGDPLYNKEDPEGERQALHAWRLVFVHPRTNEKLTITCPLPDGMIRLWQEQWKGCSGNVGD